MMKISKNSLNNMLSFFSEKKDESATKGKCYTVSKVRAAKQKRKQKSKGLK